MLTQQEQRQRAKNFSKKWEGVGYEKGDSQKFWLSLLSEVYGVEYPSEFINFEDQIKMDHTAFIDGYIPSTYVLIEQKSMKVDLNKGIRQSDGSLLSPFQQAKRYSANLPYSQRPRWIITSNFKEFYIYDMENPQGEPEIILLKDLDKEYNRMNFLINKDDTNIAKEKELSLTAGRLVGILYDALLKEYKEPEDPETLKNLNVLCVRLVFCLYAEDAGLFGKKSMFHDYLYPYKDNPAGFRRALQDLFIILDKEEQVRDPYLSDVLSAFPYVNGGLFENEQIIIPRINGEIIDIILNRASLEFDWSEISPTIFGAVFESTLNPETRHEGGMHYTSLENIHKVIDPLFLDDLNEEFEEIKNIKTINIKNKRLDVLQNKLASLTFLDPAAGSGNFLTETYISLRRLENKIIKEKISLDATLGMSTQMIMGDRIHNPIKVTISQFYGIEINDFAATVAKTALWIAESQMIRETEDIVHTRIDFFPLKSYANIVEGNALRVQWKDVLPTDKLNYIMGNPPFLGARLMSSGQKDDMQFVFGKIKNLGNLDYVSAWYRKAAEYIKNTNIKAALVSTNSITQGEQVSILWNNIEDFGIEIDFAYETFKWGSEASDMAAVHCVIIGFSDIKASGAKKIFSSSGAGKIVENINGYLKDAPNIYLENRSKPLFEVPIMGIGNKPIDGGNYLFTKEEMEEFIKKEPKSKAYFYPWYGAVEFINKKPRYCLLAQRIPINEIRNMQTVKERIQNVKDFRLKSSSKGTVKIAETPMKFHVTNLPDSDYLLVPRVTSENRRYIPIGFMDNNAIASDATLIIPDATLYDFGILISNVHMGWMRTVSGRLKSDYRYSAGIVYNNFPWPEASEEQRELIEKSAQKILDARNLYPDLSYTDLYDELTMPIELREAHRLNDSVVMKAYGFDWKTMTESECVAELMKMYQKLTEN